MTKDEARKMLEEYIDAKAVDYMSQGYVCFKLPINDEHIYTKVSFDKEETVCESWTFVGLLKFIYDLEDKQQ